MQGRDLNGEVVRSYQHPDLLSSLLSRSCSFSAYLQLSFSLGQIYTSIPYTLKILLS